ncbi:MAG: FecR family protein [Candidatus Cloacimonetes bacterium]|nr:FecR family protein [Candidatus Cloacimonadota bacterium]
MKRIALISLLFCMCLANLVAGDNVALLTANKGKVEFTRGTKILRFKTGELLQNSDEIRTGGESFAAYKYVDGSSTVKVFANSVVKINAASSGKTMSKKIVLTKGSVFSSVTQKSGSYTVQTPSTVASVKGTGFLTKITSAKQSMFIVSEGEVTLDIFNNSELQSVSKGSTAVVEADGRFTIRESTPEDLAILEKEEQDALRGKEDKTMRIPVIDSSGRSRYIEITY